METPKQSFNEKEVITFWKMLGHEEETELRAIIPQKETFSHHFKTEQEFLKLVKMYNGTHNIYLGVNERKHLGTKANEVVRLKIIPVDIDCIKKPASDEDIMEAMKLTMQIIADCELQNFKKPMITFSGNGYQMFFKIPKIELNDDNYSEIGEKVKEFSRRLISRYSNNIVRLDEVGDLPRIMRIAGTYNLKSKTLSKIISEGEGEDESLKEHLLTITIEQQGIKGEIPSELKEKILENDIIKSYMEGNLQGKASRSEAELSLVCRLVQIGLDKEQIFKVMTACKLGKWQEASVSYRELTYRKAIEVITAEKKREEQTMDSLRVEVLTSLTQKNRPIATELIVERILRDNHIYTTRSDIDSEMWIYKEGIYIPNGKSYVKEFTREVVGEVFTSQFYNDVINKIEADTYIDSKDFFSAKYVYELPVMNGILNIKTRELTPFTHEKIYFNKSPIVYEKGARCPAIDKFLCDVLQYPEDRLVYYELGGSCLMKEYLFEKAFMFVGRGRNGKGKSLELLKRTIGAENCYSLPLSALNSSNADVSQLFGKMVNLAGDIGNQDLKDMSMFKGLTGRDLITTKRKYLQALTFENYAKFIFACNELPKVWDTSEGFWDRWIMLEFPYYFATQEEYSNATSEERENWKLRDEGIIDKIVTPEELSGLLNAFLDGFDRIMKNRRFSSTKGTEEVRNTWIRKSDSFQAFCMDNIEIDAQGFILKKELRARFIKYCKTHKIKSATDKQIKNSLEMFFGADEGRKGSNPFEQDPVWEGISWKKG